MKKFFYTLFATILCMSTTLSSTDAKVKPIAKDMVLIYSGGAHRSHTWTQDLFAPYVSMKNEEGNVQWLFDGYLFLEIHNGTRGFASGYRKLPCRKEEWKKLLDDYFTPGINICALNDEIGKVRKEAPKHFFKKKIVIGMPEPIPHQKDWGEVNGKQLDFDNQEDRMTACQWFVDYAIQKFKEAKLKNVELSGFYWIAEEATNSRGLSIQVGDYVRSKKYNFNWIPYYRSDGFQDWRKLGFDIAYLQPNYFFNDKIPIERLDNACKLGYENHMSMEMEFDDRALHGQGFGYRLDNYIAAFDKYGVYDNLPIAYYQGNLTFYNLAKSTNAEDHQRYMALASRIAKRQAKKIFGIDNWKKAVDKGFQNPVTK